MRQHDHGADAPVAPADPDSLVPSLRFKVGEDVAVGPGKAELLDLIRETGSIAAAGRRMGMSYKRAWMLVATMNRCFASPLVTASRGGSEHGGAVLTETGEAVLALFRRMVATLETSPEAVALRGLVRNGAAPAAGIPGIDIPAGE